MIGVGSGPHDTPRPASREAGGRWSELDLASLDPESEQPYWVALSQVPGIGPAGFAQLLQRYGSARAAWAAGDALLAAVPRGAEDAPLVLRRLRRDGVPDVHRKVRSALSAVNGRVITALDAAYPSALRSTDPRPAVLYVAGELEALEAPTVAVVGTRRASGYGRSAATEISDELARAGVTVVSGLALGVDGEAHAAAVNAGGRSVAVLPSPLDRVYPPRHRSLARRLVDSGGAIISELPPGSLTGRPDFARRNRIIAALARAVVVVEAPDRSGALLTAAAAVDLGREVYAVPGPIHAVNSRGCNRLIADHVAGIVTSAVGLVAAIGLRRGDLPPSVASLSDTEALVLGTLFRRPGSLEELLGRTGLGTGALASVLTLLEARGLVTNHGGITFHPTLAARRIGRG